MDDDGLKEFVKQIGWVDIFCNPETAAKMRSWFAELLTAREYIPMLERRVENQQAAIQRWADTAAILGQRAGDLDQRLASLRHGAQHYVERNKELERENRELKVKLYSYENPPWWILD